jgi:hypothetical protein
MDNRALSVSVPNWVRSPRTSDDELLVNMVLTYPANILSTLHMERHHQKINRNLVN